MYLLTKPSVFPYGVVTGNIEAFFSLALYVLNFLRVINVVHFIYRNQVRGREIDEIHHLSSRASFCCLMSFRFVHEGQILVVH